MANNGFMSRRFYATFGVTQDSNLGPLLFIVFVNGGTEIIDVPSLMYADDMKLFYKIKSSDDCNRLLLYVLGVNRILFASWGPTLWENHINRVIAESYSMFGFIIRYGRNFTGVSTLKLLYNCFVRSRMCLYAMVSKYC